MSNIIGYVLDPRDGEPRGLFDAIRNELFVDLPTPESEVDVFVVFKEVEKVTDTDGEEVPIFEVIDYRVGRIDQEYLTDRDEYDHSDPEVEEARSEYFLMAMDDWARSIPGMDVYCWVHRHADGYVEASRKDHKVMQTLVAIDYARGNKHERQFLAGMIIDSNESMPLFAGRYWPPLFIGVLEIDIEIAEEALRQIIVDGIPEDALVRQAAQWQVDNLPELDALRAAGEQDSPRGKELEAEILKLMSDLKAEIAQQDPLAALFDRGPGHAIGGAMLGMDKDGNVIESEITGDMPPEIREILSRLVEDIKATGIGGTHELRIDGNVASPFDPPPVKGDSIFDLPEIGSGQDDDLPKINWN